MGKSAEQEIAEPLENGENSRIEFKRCGGDIGNDVMETVCAFLNRFGGDILLGVENDGTVMGVPEEAAQGLQRQLVNRARNPNEMRPAAYVDTAAISVEGKTVLRVRVEAVLDVFSFKGVVYDRLGDADVRVTSTSELASMYLRKTSQHTENRVFP